MDFAALGLSGPLLARLAELGHASPTPIQLAAIPAVLEGRDLQAQAPTGSGKTAAFALPLLQRLGERLQTPLPRSAGILVLVPTRELAEQVAAAFGRYGADLQPAVLAAVGGVTLAPQIEALAAGVDVLVATPGRLLDLLANEALSLGKTACVVLDEADRMLSLGFARELDAIFEALPKRRQVLLFSATYPAGVTRLAASRLRQPLRVEPAGKARQAPPIRQWVVPVDKKRKPGLLLHLLRDRQWAQVLVFVKTRAGAEQLLSYLQGKDLAADSLHGEREQAVRSRTLADFAAGRLQVLVATDVAARGLDIACLPAVVNFDLPTVAEDYLHRIGRTGRAGQPGEAVSLVCADEAPLLAAIERRLNKSLSRDEEPGFEPVHAVPFTSGPSAKPMPPAKKGPRRPSTVQGPSAGRSSRGGPSRPTNAGPGGRRNRSR